MSKVLLAGLLLCILAATLAGIGCDLFSAGLTPGTQPPPPGNNPPTASAQATTSTNINVGDSVSFSAAASSDSDGTVVSYGWDADNDGAFDDATGVSPTITFNTAGTFNVNVRVVDNGGASDTLNTAITVVVAPILDLTMLNAVSGTTPPVLDGVADETIWADAPGLVIPLGDGMETFSCGTCHSQNSATTVTLKAARTGSDITILATWPDATASIARAGSWSFETAAWGHSSGVTGDAGDDRISIFWPIGAIGGDDYDTGGCMTKCHDGNGAYLASGTADMWHTKSARCGAVTSTSGTNLVIDPVTYQITGGTLSQTGFADDKYIGPDRPLDGDRGRYGDAGSSTYSHNRIDDKSRPKYMETNPTDFLDAMYLTQAEIDGGQVVGDATTGVSDTDAATYWSNYSTLGALVPERITTDPTGSRGDITSGATWENGFWTLEMTRALDTGNVDDIAFTIGGEYQFGVAIMDNTGGGGHKPSEQFFLRVY